MATTNINNEAANILSKIESILHRATISVDVDAISGVDRLLHRFRALVGAVEEGVVLVERHTPDEVVEETFGPLDTVPCEDYV